MSAHTVTIMTTPEGAEAIRISLAHHALAVRQWAVMPSEDGARRSLAIIERALSDIDVGIAMAKAVAPAEVGG